MATVQHWSGRNYEVRTEPIEVTSYGGRPDPDWMYTDHAGHTHTRTSDTYRWVVTYTYWCPDCHEDHDKGEYRCNACGETIHPGMLPPSPFREYIVGPRRFLIDDREVSEAEFRSSYAADHGTQPPL